MGLMLFLTPDQQCQSTEGRGTKMCMYTVLQKTYTTQPPKTLLPTVQLMIYCYSYVKYYAILVSLSLLLSETICA